MPKMKKKKTRGRPCAVEGCSNNDPYRTYHRIPTNPVMRQLWEAADVGLTNLSIADQQQVKSWDRICSGHFTQWDFTLEQGIYLSNGFKCSTGQWTPCAIDPYKFCRVIMTPPPKPSCTKEYP